MEYRFLGETGLKVSCLTLGTMNFTADTQPAAAARLVHAALDAGINCFDCADLYAKGRAEELLGAALRGRREDALILTKAYFPIREGVNNAGLSRRYLVQAVEASLRRLGTDYIDLFFMHRFDERTGLYETLRALDDLVRDGKIRAVGASNFAAWQVAKALGIQLRHGWVTLCGIQPMYNLVKRQAEVELLPMAAAEGIGVLAYSPLGAGLLTGKYRGKQRPETGRLVTNPIYRTRYGEAWMYEVADRFLQWAEGHGYDPVALAIAWVATHPAMTSVIIGPRDPDQLERCLGAVQLMERVASQRDEIGALSPAPPPATDRNEELTGDSYSLR